MKLESKIIFFISLISITILLLLPAKTYAQISGRCVGGVCADGYTGCGCDAECCRRRLQGSGYGGSSSGGSGSGADYMTSFSTGMALGSMFYNATNQPTSVAPVETPEQVAERQRREAEYARQRAEQERLRQLALDQEAIDLLALADAPNSNDDKSKANKPKLVPYVKPPKNLQAGVAPVPCAPGTQQYICHTLMCGGSTNNDVCCPDGSPYLSHCDCRCHQSTDNFECNSYSACQYSYEIK